MDRSWASFSPKRLKTLRCRWGQNDISDRGVFVRVEMRGVLGLSHDRHRRFVPAVAFAVVGFRLTNSVEVLCRWVGRVRESYFALWCHLVA
jgi:hypothetical protein